MATQAHAPPGMRRDHFARLVRAWDHFGPPLRPSPSDTAIVQHAASRLAAGCHVAVLGLTPETVGCHWPQATRLLAIDHSPAMLAALWPPAAAPQEAFAVLADWNRMPLPDASLDLVCADGCHTPLSYPHGFAELAVEVRRLLRPGGQWVMRVFTRPDRPETVSDIGADLARGGIGSVHALKLRLLAALHGRSGPGTCLDDVWQASKQLPALPAGLAGQRGWTAEEITGIAGYAGLATRYYLPTLAELRAVHAPLLRERSCHTGSYAQAAVCPTLVLERAEGDHGL